MVVCTVLWRCTRRYWCRETGHCLETGRFQLCIVHWLCTLLPCELGNRPLFGNRLGRGGKFNSCFFPNTCPVASRQLARAVRPSIALRSGLCPRPRFHASYLGPALSIIVLILLAVRWWCHPSCPQGCGRGFQPLAKAMGTGG